MAGSRSALEEFLDLLAPEISSHFLLFRFDPKTDEQHWFLEHIDAIS